MASSSGSRLLSMPAEVLGRIQWFLAWHDAASLYATCDYVSRALSKSSIDRPVLSIRYATAGALGGKDGAPARLVGLRPAAVAHVLQTSKALEEIVLGAYRVLRVAGDGGGEGTQRESLTIGDIQLDEAWPAAHGYTACQAAKPAAEDTVKLLVKHLPTAAGRQLHTLQLQVLLPAQPCFTQVDAWVANLRHLAVNVTHIKDSVTPWLKWCCAFPNLESLSVRVYADTSTRYTADTVTIAPKDCPPFPKALKSLNLEGFYVDRNLRASIRAIPALESLSFTLCRIPKAFDLFENCSFSGHLKDLTIDSVFIFHKHGERTLKAITENFEASLERFITAQDFWMTGSAEPLRSLGSLKELRYGCGPLGHDQPHIFEELQGRGVVVTTVKSPVTGREVADPHPDSEGDNDD